MSKQEFLVGYTGFVGSNLANSHSFSELFNSKNIADAFNKNPDLLVYAGIPARKFYANQNPEEDLRVIENAMSNIKKINPKTLVLISTIDVISNPDNFYETDQTNKSKLQPYGHNRLLLEEWANANFSHCRIIRLPALFGDNLKKNFIFDIINPIPSVIETTKFSELSSKNPNLNDYYHDNHDGFYKLSDNLDKKSQYTLEKFLEELNFTALNFTDSRAEYQFYNLQNLWSHINITIKNNLPLLHLATEPVKASEIYEYIFHQNWQNELEGSPAKYNYKTIYDQLLGGKNGYIFTKDQILSDLNSFITKNLEQKYEN